MKKRLSLIMALLLSLTVAAEAKSAPSPAEATRSSLSTLNSRAFDDDCVKKVEYTEAQKKVLDKAYEQLYQDYEKLFQSYVEFGAMEKGQKERHLRMLKEYIARVKEHHYRWCNDDDEWDEDDRWTEGGVGSWKIEDVEKNDSGNGDRIENGNLKENEGKGEKGTQEKKEWDKEDLKKKRWEKEKHKGKGRWKRDDDRWERDDDRWERDDMGERED
ncbi:MAG: hypothetical protein IMW85_07075 [Thermicanus sp.]|nr:hypothetical protein [Thermicanus sp.]